MTFLLYFTFVSIHSLNMGPLVNTDCSQRYGLYAPTSSLVTTDTSYLVGLTLPPLLRAAAAAAALPGLQRTTMKVWRKWLLMQAGLKSVWSASRKTTQTMSLPMWRLRWS